MARNPQPEWWVYKEQADFLCPGDALREPASTRSYARISIGDVGFIRRGQFHLLFSAGSPLGERELGEDVPATFEELSVGIPQPVQPQVPGCLRTDMVQEIGFGLSATVSTIFPPEPGTNFSFESTGNRDAPLATKQSTCMEEDSQREYAFESYTKRHYESWVTFARQKEYGDDVQPVLVSGFDVARDFAVAAYSNESTSVESDFTFTVPTFDSASASLWKTHTNRAPHRWSPPCERAIDSAASRPAGVTSILDESNQCVSILYYTMRLKGWKFPKVIRAGPGRQDLGSGDDGGYTFRELMAQSNAECTTSGDEGIRSQWDPSMDETNFEPDAVVGNTYAYDGWDAIGDYVFQNEFNVTSVNAPSGPGGDPHDGDLCDISSLLVTKKPDIEVDESGVGIFFSGESRRSANPFDTSPHLATSAHQHQYSQDANPALTASSIANSHIPGHIEDPEELEAGSQLLSSHGFMSMSQISGDSGRSGGQHEVMVPYHQWALARSKSRMHPYQQRDAVGQMQGAGSFFDFPSVSSGSGIRAEDLEFATPPGPIFNFPLAPSSGGTRFEDSEFGTSSGTDSDPYHNFPDTSADTDGVSPERFDGAAQRVLQREKQKFKKREDRKAESEQLNRVKELLGLGHGTKTEILEAVIRSLGGNVPARKNEPTTPISGRNRTDRAAQVSGTRQDISQLFAVILECMRYPSRMIPRREQILKDVVGEIERRKAGTQPPALQGDGGPDGNQWTAQ